MMTKVISVGGIFVLAAGCASYPAPTARMAESLSSVKVAQEAGATNDPKATEYLTRANEELTSAKQQMDDGNNERADFLFLRADADAKLALELAKAQKAEGDAHNAEAQAKASMQSAQRALTSSLRRRPRVPIALASRISHFRALTESRAPTRVDHSYIHDAAWRGRGKDT